MKKWIAILLTVLTVFTLVACAKPTENELRQELTTLVAEVAVEQLKVQTYYRVNIDTLDKDGKNQWVATGNVNYSDSSSSTVAVLYTAVLCYDKTAKAYSAEVTFGEIFYI